MSVFISYRRDNGQPVAEEIYQTLCDEYDIFLDTESLKNGYFAPAITAEIEKCSDFIMIITETVFDRCTEPNDWILREAQIALQNKKNIIPIFVGVKNFPSNVPDSLKIIPDLNSIFWHDTTTCEKIKSFLISNRRYILSVVPAENRAALDAVSKQELKELYQRFLTNGRLPADIEIQIKNPKELSALLISDYMINEFGRQSAEHLAEQTLLSKVSWVKKSLEIAIEYLLQDELIDDCAMHLRDFYINKYGIENCVFTNAIGLQSFYWTPFLWIDIIEELLKELLSSRYNDYGSSEDFVAIDCTLITVNDKELWSFPTFVRKQPDDERYNELMRILKIPFGRGDYMDLPLHSLAFHVYPDFFFNIGQLKANKTVQSFEKINQHKDVFNLLRYYIGFH